VWLAGNGRIEGKCVLVAGECFPGLIGLDECGVMDGEDAVALSRAHGNGVAAGGGMELIAGIMV
jgi:hypothetical protein